MTENRLSATLDRLLEGLLWLVLAWLPFAYGGVQPVSHMVLVVAAGAMAVLLVVRCMVGPIELRASWSFVPLLLFVLLVFVQVLPGSGEVLGSLAPGNLRLWQELTGNPPLATPVAPTVTMNPAATAADLRLLLALAVLFVAAAQVLRRRGALRRFLTAVAVVGAAVVAVALLQDLTGTDSMLWLRKVQAGKATAGPFVHYGHFSQFVNLTLGAGLGLLLLRLAERDQRNHYVVEDLVRDLGAPDRRLDLFLFGFFVLGAVAICLSRSRNGVLSMVVAGAVTALLLHRTRYLRGMGWSLAGLGAAAFLVLLLVGFDPVYDRLQTLDEEATYNFRLALAQDGLTAFTRFPWLGSGQGTFGDVFPMFDTMVRPGRAEHAENQYVELLVETGIVGAGLIAWFVVAVVRPWLRRMRAHRDGGDGALFGLLFGVLAVAVHATSDFGLRIPAVVAMAMACLGAVVGRTGNVLPATGRVRAVAAAGFAVAAGLLFLQLPALLREQAAYEHTEAAKAVGQRAANASEIDELLRWRDRQRGHWAAAIEATPERGDYQVAYATAAWLSVVAAERVDFVRTPAPMTQEQEQRLQQAARLIQQALLEARRLGPVRGDLWSLVGQIGVEWLGDPAAAAWIERGFRQAPENPTVCAAWARQLLKSGDADGAARMYTRAIQMGSRADSLLPAIARDLARPDIALAVARGNPRWLLVLVQQFRGDKERAELRATAREELGGRLRELTAHAEAPAWTFAGLAELEAEDGHPAEAIVLYRRYLSLVPNSGVRLSLARQLQKTGDLDGARQEVRRFLNYEPGHQGARRLLTELGK